MSGLQPPAPQDAAAPFFAAFRGDGDGALATGTVTVALAAAAVSAASAGAIVGAGTTGG
jgi:hypothetical protein